MHNQTESFNGRFAYLPTYNVVRCVCRSSCWLGGDWYRGAVCNESTSALKWLNRNDSKCNGLKTCLMEEKKGSNRLRDIVDVDSRPHRGTSLQR